MFVLFKREILNELGNIEFSQRKQYRKLKNLTLVLARDIALFQNPICTKQIITLRRHQSPQNSVEHQSPQNYTMTTANHEPEQLDNKRKENI